MFMFSESEEAHSYCYEASFSGPHHKLVFQSKLLGIKQLEEATAAEEGLLLGAAMFRHFVENGNVKIKVVIGKLQ